ncbi:copper homeostasis protein CutC [Ensifer soli]|uniref:copper homeostasis protein CutC n=1 Tax=Ciceribacter sp. sgz301302 TaxID=3342379 RepID=UPI0035BAE7B8
MSTVLLEVCVDDAEGLAAAVAGGADRIELCSALALGGLTPSRGLMARAAAAPVPAYAMIRPRGGGFVYGDADLAVMSDDIAAARDVGLAGVVLGASRPDGRLDTAVLARLSQEAGPLGRTLHRAVDLSPDLSEAVDSAVALGFERILTSGGQRTAVEGIDALEAMVARAAGRISIMPGAGIRVDTLARLLPRLAVTEIHASCALPVGGDPRLAAFGFEMAGARRTGRAAVGALKGALLALRPR